MGGDGPKNWKDSERIANVEAGSHAFLPVAIVWIHGESEI